MTEQLIGAQDLETFRQIGMSLLAKFPAVSPWFEWWLRDAHASMLFESQRCMDPVLWNSLPSTTNAEESMHWKIYSAVGEKHAVMEGICSLFAFVQHYDKLIASARVGIKTRYGQPERWKITAKQLGRTKRSRRPHSAGGLPLKGRRPSARYHNDGR
ncbi:hypothetical protein C8Q80DRAFT_1246646, partial [Daedaleopsis nitida]